MSRDEKVKMLRKKLKDQGYLNLDDGLTLTLLASPEFDKYLTDWYNKPNILLGLKKKKAEK